MIREKTVPVRVPSFVIVSGIANASKLLFWKMA
jgi:hypothetical protein